MLFPVPASPGPADVTHNVAYESSPSVPPRLKVALRVLTPRKKLVAGRIVELSGCVGDLKGMVSHAVRFYFTVALTGITAFAAVRCSLSLVEPAQTNCKPAKIAIIATTVLSLAAGILRASRHPNTMPGTPPASSCARTGMFIEPK